MKTTATKLVYGMEEAAEQLGVTRSRAFQLVASGTLKSFKDGRRRLVTHKELEKCVEAMQRASDKGKKARADETTDSCAAA